MYCVELCSVVIGFWLALVHTCGRRTDPLTQLIAQNENDDDGSTTVVIIHQLEVAQQVSYEHFGNKSRHLSSQDGFQNWCFTVALGGSSTLRMQNGKAVKMETSQPKFFLASAGTLHDARGNGHALDYSSCIAILKVNIGNTV